MELKTTLTEALEATSRLQAVLDREDVALYGETLESRRQALDRFEQAHRNADPGEAAACRALLRELIEADRALQETCAQRLSRLTAEFRGMATSGPAPLRSDFHAPSRQACVNRKA